jgi:hypothetical protein
MLLKTKIAALLREISEKTSIYSFHIYDQPQLLEIIALGDEAVPFLLEHLKESKAAEIAKYDGYDFYDYSPWYAIIALTRITGANPIKPEHAGRLYNIVDDWLTWKPEDENAGGNLTYWPVD